MGRVNKGAQLPPELIRAATIESSPSGVRTNPITKGANGIRQRSRRHPAIPKPIITQTSKKRFAREYDPSTQKAATIGMRI